MVSREDKIVAFTEHGRDRNHCGMQNASKYYRTREVNDNGVVPAAAVWVATVSTRITGRAYIGSWI